MRSSGRKRGASIAPGAGAERLAVRQIVAESAADLACALLQATDYGILMTDPQGRDLVGNRRFGELFGLDVGGVVEMSRDQVRAAMHARLRDPDAFFARVDAIYRSPDWEGEDEVEIIWPEARVLRRYTAPVRDAAGGPVGRIWTFLDVTETRRLQSRLEQAAAALQEQIRERDRVLTSTTEVLQAMTHVVGAVGRAESLPDLVRQAAGELRGLFGHHCAAVLLWEEPARELRGAFAPPEEAGPAEDLCVAADREPDLVAALSDGGARISSHRRLKHGDTETRRGTWKETDEAGTDPLPFERSLFPSPSVSPCLRVSNVGNPPPSAIGPLRLRPFQAAAPGPLLERGCGAGRLVPLVIENQVRGLVLWGGDPPADRWTARTAEQMEAVAALVGIAIETHLLQARLAETLDELRQAQAQLVQTERVAAAATLATSVAHDIRNIITPLTVELGMLSGDAGDTFQAAREQVHRLAVLTQRLLAIARPARVARSPVCLVELLRRLEPLLRTQAELENCRIAWRCEPRQADVEADDSQIEQVILNLVMNGIQAMAPQGGELRIALKHTGDTIRLSVRDHGSGVPPEAREAIFRPFYTTKRSGTGLGLFSCRRIAEEHGGAVLLENPADSDASADRGAMFTLVLPAIGPPE